MIIVIVLAGLAVMGVAAIAGTGRFGEWSEPVTDRRKGHMPEGLVDESFMGELEIPVAMNGYDRGEVDELLRAASSGAPLMEPPHFGIIRNGYDMQFVDAVIRRAMEPRNPLPSDTLVGDAGRMDDSENKE